jgi:PAS domain S-box-containing protein
MADQDEVRSIRPVAFSGSDNSYVSQIKATWGDDVRGLGPAGTSIKTGRTVFIQDFEKDPRTGPWKELAHKNGFRSSIAIPLKDSEVPFGTFLLYSDQVNGFSAEELDLLEEMARDLAYGVIGLRVRKEQEIAEMTLKESEERFRTLSENTFEGIVIIIDDIIIDVNDSMAHTLGYRTEEMIGRSFTDFVTSESIELLRKHQDMKSHRPYEAQAITRHGDVLTVQIRGKDIIWKGRQARLKSIRDMTEQKRVVSALHESEERYRSLYFDSRDAIMILSPERGFLSGNPATCRLFGCQDDDDFISHSPSSFSPEHQPDGSLSSEKSQQMMGLALANGKQFFEWTHRRADGADFPATVLLSRLEDSNEPLLQATVRDITLLKQAEEECRQNGETMRLVIASAPFPLLITNWDGTYILDANSQALEAFGAEIGQGQRLADLFEEETELERVMNDLASHASVDGMEVTLRGKGGEPRWHVLSARTISYPGEERLLLATHDITERRMMGKALNDANQKLGILNRITRHDMLNQMTVLKGFLELIEAKEKDPKILLYLEKISWAANNLEKQIAFTKDYQEIGVKAPGWVSIGNKSAEAFAMLHPDGVTIEDSSGGVEILADQLAEKIPYNLIDNSMRHGEHITQIKVMAEQVGGAMHIIYQDDGVGISEKDREHIFEKGFGKNTGLGLFISREILAITGISIEETGQGGKGVRFEISVPAGAWRIPSLLIKNG